MKKFFLAIVFILGFCVPSGSGAEIDPLEALEERRRAIGEMMEASTVFVLCEDEDSYSFGSGFIVADGYVMTNGHVVEGAEKITIMNSRLKPTKATLVRRNYKDENPGDDDFALLKFSSSTKLPVLLFNTQVARMDRVSAWGFPALINQFDKRLEDVLSGNMSQSPPVVYTEGTVSSMAAYGKRTNIIHSAQIARGNSGGPLVNGRGEVVGINTWGALDTTDGIVNASLPADRIVAFINSCGVSAQVARGSQRPLPSVASLPPQLPQPARPSEPTKPSQPSKPAEPAPEPNSFDGDMSEVLAKAKKGDADAQCFAGISYYDGSDGFPVNLKESVRWLEAASKQKNELATGMLGVIFITEPEYRNVKRGLELMRAGAKALPAFQALLANLYYEGETLGIPRNEKESFKWASMGAKGADADPDAKAQLAVLYYYGEGVEQDMQRALRLAQEAVEEDSSLGKAILAWMYYHGQVVEEDIDNAVQLALSAAEEGEGIAQGFLAVLYYNGTDVEQDLETAEAWARRAAEQANEFGQVILGHLYREGNIVKKDLPTAWAYLDFAAAKGIGDAEKARNEIDKQMSAAQKKKAKDIQSQWKKEWGIS